MSNQSMVYQDRQDQLSPIGRSQAHVLGKRLRNVPIERIVSSSLERALETAYIINRYLKKENIEVCDLLRENDNPRSIVGKAYTDPEIMNLVTEMRSHFGEVKYKAPEGGETFYDVKARALAFLRYANTFTEKNVLIVTHGMLLKLFTACVLYGPDVDYLAYQQFDTSHIISNTGITILERDEKTNERKIVSWNDIAHLGNS